jgi:hypothetical protein
VSPFSYFGTISRREFLRTAGAGLLTQNSALRVARRETIYNGITLPAPWPPDRAELPDVTPDPPYLTDPPAVIEIDVGRQLFVDDFLVEESSLYRSFHQARYHPANPVLAPVHAWEHEDPHATLTGNAPSPSAMPFSDGVFFDPADRVFKLWYMAGYQAHTALATSTDGLQWDRPRLDVVAGTNIVFDRARDSSTVWLDLDAPERSERYKMGVFLLEGRALRLFTSADGVHWRERRTAGPGGDRSTCFFNPFRQKWVFSLRGESAGGLNRYRRYVESANFAESQWRDRDAVLWAGADARDVVRADLGTIPELYNLDAVAYESVLLGLFTMYRGERAPREKPNDIVVGFSRDGFHWSRLWREPFIPVSDRQGDWNWANVQSAGGGCVIVGDQLYFYVSGRAGIPGTSLPGMCSTGLAVLRRDGFASLSDEWPPRLARRATTTPGTMTTRPVRFSRSHLFVNADVRGALRVEVLDQDGRTIAPFTAERCVAIKGDSTRHRVQWDGNPTLDSVAGRPVRFRFTLSDTSLFAFWVSASDRGHSTGYVAAGGPAFRTFRDTG